MVFESRKKYLYLCIRSTPSTKFESTSEIWQFLFEKAHNFDNVVFAFVVRDCFEPLNEYLNAITWIRLLLFSDLWWWTLRLNGIVLLRENSSWWNKLKPRESKTSISCYSLHMSLWWMWVRPSCPQQSLLQRLLMSSIKSRQHYKQRYIWQYKMCFKLDNTDTK